MSEPIIRTMWAGPESLERVRSGQSVGLFARPNLADDTRHPVLVIHAPEMPGLKKGDRVSYDGDEPFGTVTAPPAWSGEHWSVPVKWSGLLGPHWHRVDSLTPVEPPEPPKPEPDPRAELARALSEFHVGALTSSAMAAALDDYISRALGRADR